MPAAMLPAEETTQGYIMIFGSLILSMQTYIDNRTFE